MSMKILIFRPGKWNGIQFSKEFCIALAKRYNAQKGAVKAPLVIGHQWQTKIENELAEGWVTELEYTDSGIVYALCNEVSENLKGYIEDKRLRYASIEFKYSVGKDEAIENPDLLRVALLGRHAPAVKGARIVKFSEEKEDDTYRTSVNFDMSEQGGVVSSFEEHTNIPETKEEDMNEVQQMQETLAKNEVALAEKDKRIAELEAKEKLRESEAFADSLVKEGRLTPSQKDAVASLHASLSGEQQKQYGQTLKASPVLTQLSKQETVSDTTGSLSLSDKVKAYQAKHGIGSYADALQRLSLEDAEFAKQLKAEQG